MLRSAAISRIKRGLGFRTDLDSVIVDALQEAQREREAGKTAPWFLLREDQPLVLAASNQDVTLPTDFWQTKRKEGIHFTLAGTTTTRFVPRYDLENAIKLFGEAGSGAPQAVVLRTLALRFFPVPDTTYNLLWSYYMHDALLDTDIENKWLKYAGDLLIGDAGLIVAADLRDKDAITIFTKLQANGVDQAFKETIQRELDDYPLRMGEML